MILIAGLCSGARQRFAAGAVDRLEGQKVLRANLRYRTVEDGGTCRPLAKFPRNFRRELRILASAPSSGGFAGFAGQR